MEEKKENGKLTISANRVVLGIVTALLAAALYTAGFLMFERGSTDATQIEYNPLETQETMNWLMEENLVLYRELMQEQSAEPVSYLGLYVKPAEGCEWVLDEEACNTYLASGFSETMMESADVNADVSAVYSYLRYLQQEYFKTLEKKFSDINYTFDYYCEDTVTGKFVSNLDPKTIESQTNYLYLCFEFDENGNCSVESSQSAEYESPRLRKLANEAARTVRLESDIHYSRYSEDAKLPLNTYITMQNPANCRMVYCISLADWERAIAGEEIRLCGNFYDISVSYAVSMRIGIIFPLLETMLFITAVAAFFCPLPSEERKMARRKMTAKAMELPLEVMAVLGNIGVLYGLDLSYYCAVDILSKYSGGTAERLAVRLALIALFYAVALLLFLFVWYIGCYLAEIRRNGMLAFIRQKSLIYRIFPFIKSKLVKFYNTVSHFDVTKNANKLIIRLVLINALILFTICSLWVGGLGIAAVYSVLLYFILRKYVSDLQKKYGVLLKATNEIAEGSLNVHIEENLGVFEPFKPQVYRIQEGFRRAVEEEVKSQRMKAELITNVSHDLKTPLTAIITYVNLLKEESINEEQRREYLGTLERKSMRLKVLIDDLFEISKATSLNMTLNIMDVDVMNLVKQVAFEMGDKLSGKNLDLRMTLCEEKAVLPLDSQRTYRIYENLFANIAKYAMPGTRVYVNGFCVEDKVIITLKNITEKEINVKAEELTDRFVRGDISRNSEGSGLGLAIAKSFMELQGGELEIEVDGDLFKATTVWQSGR